MKTKLLALALLAGSSMFGATRFSVGINFGGYNQGYYAAAAPAYVVARPPCPGPDYIWTGGYWERNAWRDGYWSRPAYHSYVQNRDREFERDRFVNNGFRRDRDDDHYRSRYR